MANSMANSGKGFEAMFHRSLLALPGVSMRIEDGGKVAKNRQLGDFLAWDDGGGTWLFECKSTQEASLPFANFGDHQIAGLVAFERHAPSMHAAVAIRFARTGTVALVPALAMARYMASSGRRSLPEADALRIGIEAHPCRDAAGRPIVAIDFDGLCGCHGR